VRCFAIIIPPDSSVDQGKVEEIYEKHIKFFDGAWFVATGNDTTADSVRSALEIGKGPGMSGVVVLMDDPVGFARKDVADALIEWKNTV